MRVLFQRGIHLPGPQLWLDPHRKQACAVVTHAHSDHVRRHTTVWSSRATAAMMRLRGISKCSYVELEFGRPFASGDAFITLFPAGHVLGSAQVLVEYDGVRLLYSGDFKMRPGLSAEPIEVPQADIVVMETTFGRPRYRFPPAAEIAGNIRAFCDDSMRAGIAPVLFCYSLGKGQEVLAGLNGVPYPIYLHHQHYQLACLYQEHGVTLPPFTEYQPGQHLDGVLLCSSACRRSDWFPQRHRVRTAYVSGWAAELDACWRFGTDAAFPLSDHADYSELMEYVSRTGARRVYTVHGFAHEFAADLCYRGYQAEPLLETVGQLSLF